MRSGKIEIKWLETEQDSINLADSSNRPCGVLSLLSGMDTASLWSAHAGEYNDTAAHITNQIAGAAFESVEPDIPESTSTLIDICCGTGALTILAAERFTADSGVDILATDYAEGMVAFTAGFAAAKAWPHVKTKVMDAGVRSDLSLAEKFYMLKL